jgi:hypothetical protein
MCTLSGRDEAPKPPANDSKQRTPDDVIFDYSLGYYSGVAGCIGFLVGAWR